MNDKSPPNDFNPFHMSHWPRSIVTPEEYDGGERLQLSWDLGAVDEKKKRRVIQQWCNRLPEFQNIRWLNIWSHVTQPLFDAACKLGNLECFQIKWSNIKDLSGIQYLQSLRYLRIGSSTRVESLQPLIGLTGLKILDIENFKLISDFTPLLSLVGLESLAVTGSMWTRQKVASLEPFSQMTWLKHLAVDTSSVKSLRPLASLKGLRTLDIGGRLPMQEYAWLSAKLPDTDCRWFSPYLDLSLSGIGRCKRCQNESMIMLAGRGTKTLCLTCDKTDVDKHVLAFNLFRDKAMAE
jgi:hypothetical protein